MFVMSTFNNNLAEWAKSLVGILSLRQAEYKTGVSYSTIQNIIIGRKVGAESIIRFARGFHQDIPTALRMAGYDDIAEMWEGGVHIEDEVEPRFKAPKEPHTPPPDVENMEQPFPPENDPVMQDTFGYLGRVAKTIPPGPAREAYLASLRANADANREFLRKMTEDKVDKKKSE